MSKYLIFLIAVLLVVTPLSSDALDNTFVTPFNNGIQALNQNKNLEAQKFFQSALKQSQNQKPDIQSQVFYHLGLSYFRNKQYKEAEIYFKKAVPLFAKGEARLADALTGLGNIAQFDKRTDEAINYYKQALSGYAASGKPQSALARSVQSSLNDLILIKGGNTINASSLDIYHQGVQALQEKHYPDAQRLLKLALSQAEGQGANNLAQILYHLGFSYSENMQDTEAEVYFTKAIPLLSGEKARLGDVLGSLGLIAQHQNRIDEAISNYNKALAAYAASDTPNETQIQDIKNNLNYLTRLKAGEKVIAVTEGPPGFDLLTQAQDALEAREYEKAAHMAESFINTPKVEEHPRLLLSANKVLVETYYRHQDYVKAIPVLETILSLQAKTNDSVEEMSVTLTNLVSFNQSLGKYQQAEKWNQKLASLPGQKRITTEDVLQEFKKRQPQPLTANKEDYYSLQSGDLIRWNSKTSQIWVYLKDGQDLEGWHPEYVELVKAAFSEWQKALEDRIQFVFVTDKKQYDVLVDWKDAQKLDLDELGGRNDKTLWNNYIALNNITFSLKTSEGVYFSPAALQTIALHEIGHMLGLWHSDDVGDVMSEEGPLLELVEPLHLSKRDVNTMLTLYRQKPEYTNPEGYHLSDFSTFVAKQRFKGGGSPFDEIIMPGHMGPNSYY
jgi:tetratricopeptide (TPR) repeat protein